MPKAVTERIWALPLLVALFGVVYAVGGLFRHWNFNSGAYDLGIFDQVIWHLSRFESPSSSIRGYSNMLGDHFSPILMLLAPLYWVAPGPEVLILAQAGLLSLSIVPVFLYAKRRLPDADAFAIAVAYALFWGVQRTAMFDFHEMAFAPLVIALAILAMDGERWILFWAMCAILVGVKEDLIALVGGFGLLVLIRGRVRQGVAAIAASCAAFLLIVGMVIPAMNDVGRFIYTSTYEPVLSRPWRIPMALVTPALKLRTLLALFAPFAFLPMLSPLSLLVVPIAVERFLSASPNLWGTAFHYWAPLAPVLAMGAADGLARIRTWLRARGRDRDATATIRTLAAACVLLAAFIPGHQPHWRLLRPATYTRSPSTLTGNLLLALIPSGASVVAQGQIVPHLSHRDRLFLLDANPPDTEFVVATERLEPWPLASVDELRLVLAARRQQGYESVFERDGWVLLRRTPARTD
jgi:uncharacterized membrane protein